MIIDGKKIAGEILSRTKKRAGFLPRAPHILAISAGDNAATNSYLKIKEARALDAGCVLGVKKFREDVFVEELISTISSSSADSIIVQLPLPKHIDSRDVRNSIPFSKDADVLSRLARENFESRDDAILPPVVGAVKEILDSQGVFIKYKKAVVVGNGFLVGMPVANWLDRNGAIVKVVTIESGDLEKEIIDADIIVCGAGSPGIIKPDMIKDGVVLIDAGTSEANGKVVGDADPECANKCSVFTPVPGGVGPIAVAKLFENVVRLAENKGL